MKFQMLAIWLLTTLSTAFAVAATPPATQDFTESFAFSYSYSYRSYQAAYKIAPGFENGSLHYFCDVIATDLKVGSQLTCFRPVRNDYGILRGEVWKVTITTAVDNNGAFGFHFDTSEYIDQTAFSSDFLNQIQFVSPKHPLLVVHDIKKGTWTIGIQ